MITEQLVAYIKEQSSAGMAREAVTGILIAQGWQKSDIDAAFAIALQPPMPAPAEQPLPPAVQEPQPLVAQPIREEQKPVQFPEQPQSVQPIIQDVRPATPQAPAMQPPMESAQGPGVRENDPGDTKSIFALTSLIAGLVSIIANFLPVRGTTAAMLSGGSVFVFAVGAIVLGVMGIKSSRKLVATIGMILGILGIIVFASLFAYGFIVSFVRIVGQQGISPAPAARVSYTDAQGRFSMMPPQGWQTDTSGQKGTLVIFVNPVADHDGSSAFQSNINVVSGSLGGKTLDEYVDAQKAALGANFKNLSLLNDTSTVINGAPARMIEISFATNGMTLHDLQASIADNGTLYVVTASTLDASWDAYQGQFTQALGSFALGTATSTGTLSGPQALLALTPYHDQKNGFVIDPPRAWKMDTTGSFGTLALFMSPAVENTGAGTFVTNLSVASVGAKGLTLDAFVDLNMQQNKAKVKDFSIIKDSRLVLNGTLVRVVEQTLTDNGLKIHDLQLFALKDNVAYLVTGNALDASWASYEATIRAALNTFQFE